MSWKNFLRSASFRGIPFFVQVSETSAGRKVAVHEFPEKDKNFVEDLGKETRSFSIEAFVIGDLYKFRRDELIAACEKKGPGRLIHPHYGTLRVQVLGRIRVQERTEDGGMAILTIQFSESEKPSFPATTLDTQLNLLLKAVTVFDAISDAFTDSFNLFQQPSTIVNGVIESMDSAVKTWEDGFTIARTFAGFTETLDRLKSSIRSFNLIAGDIFNDVKSLFSENKSESGVEENLTLKDFNKNTGTIEENKKAFDILIQNTSVVGAAQAVSGIEFESTTQAEKIQDTVITAIDEMSEIVSDEIYFALHDLRSAVILDIEARSINVPRLIEIKNQIALPALFISHDLYEDIDHADDIVERNNVIHPGFVPGGITLEVLSRE